MKKLVLLAALLAAAASAEKTRQWRQSDAADFEKGVAERVSIRSDGSLTLAPKLAELYDAGSSYLWDMVVTPDGTVYAAGGPEAQVVRISPDPRQPFDHRVVTGKEAHVQHPGVDAGKDQRFGHGCGQRVARAV